jgi:hypothetical protein
VPGFDIFFPLDLRKRVTRPYKCWEAVEVPFDQVRERRGENEQALAWEREREAAI